MAATKVPVIYPEHMTIIDELREYGTATYPADAKERSSRKELQYQRRCEDLAYHGLINRETDEYGTVYYSAWPDNQA